MVFVTEYDLAGAFELLANLCRVVVVEAVTLVAEPDADRYRQTQRMRLVEDFAGVVRAPGANGVAAGRRQLLE